MSSRKFIWNNSILFEDDDYVVINKPPHISSISDRIDDFNLLGIAKQYYEDIQIGHRLDKETSGVLAFAKNPESYRNLAMQFEHRKVKKIYHAICDGVHDYRNLLVEYPLYNPGKGIIKVDQRRGKPSATRITTLKAYGKHTLVECKPLTGRTHQIRVHLASSGAPISGDWKYGGKPFLLSEIKKKYNIKKYTEEEPLIKRLALHSCSLEFKGMNSKKIKADADYPKDFKVILKQLDKNS